MYVPSSSDTSTSDTVPSANLYFTVIVLSFLPSGNQDRTKRQVGTNRHRPMQKRAQQGKGTDYATSAEQSAFVMLSISCLDAHLGFDIIFMGKAERPPLLSGKTKKAGTNIHRHIICLRDACAGCVRYVDSAPAQAGDKIFRVVPRYVGTLLTGFIVVVHNQLMQFV